MTSPLAFVGFKLSQNKDSESDESGNSGKFKLGSVVGKKAKTDTSHKSSSTLLDDSSSDSTSSSTSSTPSTSKQQDADFMIETEEELDNAKSGTETNEKSLGSKRQGSKRPADDNELLEHQTFVEYNFSKALDKCPCPEFEQAPFMKRYRVKLKQGSCDVRCVQLYKEKCGDILQVLSKKFGFRKNSGVKLWYPLKLSDGKEEKLTIVSWDTDLKQSLEDFYSQTDAFSLLEIAECNKPDKRERRPNEVQNTKVKKHGTTDKTVYKIFQQNPEIAEMFVAKQRYISTLMGEEDAVNLLSTSFFLCHVRSCEKLIKLKSFSSLSSITDHWKNHVTAVNPDLSCSMLLKRHKVLRVLNEKQPWKVQMTPDELEVKVDDLNQAVAIKPLMQGKVIARRGETFKGKHLLLNNEVLQKLIDRDPAALEGSQDRQRLITDMLGSTSSGE